MANPTYKELSQLDGMETLKSAHEDRGQNYRIRKVNSLVPGLFNRTEMTKNLSNSVTNAKFYYDQDNQVCLVRTVDDVSQSLNNKYFLLNSALDTTEYYVWFNVDGNGSDPLLPTLSGIEVLISENDPASIVATALTGTLNLYPDFTATKRGKNVTITNTTKGDSTEAGDVSTGFEISTKQAGVTTLEANIDIPYEDEVKYVWNSVEGQFEIFQPISVKPSGLNNKGMCVDVTLNDTTWTPLPLSTLSDVNAVSIQNDSSKSIRINYADTRSSSRGIKMGAGSERYYDIKESIQIYAKSEDGSVDIVIELIS